MPSVGIPGRIIAIEYDDGADYEIVSLTAGSPALIEPTGKPVTIILANNGGGSDSFKMDSDFVIGDVVEIYKVAGSGNLQVLDENSNDISPGNANDPGEGTRYRKISTGSAPTWGRVS